MKFIPVTYTFARSAAALVLAATLAAAAGCVSSAPEPPRRPPKGMHVVRPLDVYMRPDGRFDFNGHTHSFDGLVRQLRGPANANRPIQLHAHPAASDAMLGETRTRFARNGLPKVTLVKTRHSSATAQSDPPKPPRNPPPPRP